MSRTPMPRAAEVGVRGSRRGRKKKKDRARKKGDEVSSEGARARKVDGSTASLFFFILFPLLLSSFPSLTLQNWEPITLFFPSEAGIESRRSRRRTARGADAVVKPAAATTERRREEEEDAAADAGTAARRDTAALSAIVCGSLWRKERDRGRARRERNRDVSRKALNAKRKKGGLTKFVLFCFFAFVFSLFAAK